MTIVQLLAKKRISRQLFKVCRLGGFETLTQIKLYFWEHGTFKGLKWTNPEEIGELEALINADLLRLGRQWKLSEDLLKSQSLVQTAAVLLEKELLPKKQMDLFMASSRLYQGTRPRTVFELAPEMGMQERSVRGLRTSSIRKLAEKLRSLQVLREDIQLNYGLDLSSDLLVFDESLAQDINRKARTNFTPEFLGWLFGIYLEKEFATLGRPEEVLGGNHLGHRHYWKGFYLLRKEIAAALDLDALLAETYRLLNNGAGESRSLDLKTFVSHFVNDAGEGALEVLLPVTEKILYRELGLLVGGKGKLVFPKQGEPLLRRYCREALEALGEPATRERIRRKISEQHPEVFVDLAGFESVMLFDHGFTSYRHVYGLRKWFSGGGGSLKLQDPQLLQELQKKFPVKWRQYWESYWQENWQALMDFANTHSRLPKKRATGEEGRLRKFWEIQVSRCGRGNLDPEYQVLMNELRRRFPHNNKIHWKVDWDERFARIKSFAETHGVPPNLEGPGEEKTMSGWLQAQRIRMKKGNLDRRQVALLTWFDEWYHQRTKQHFQRQWEKRYQELEDFARAHSRLPREVIKEEKSLNRWFAAQRLRMSRGTLERQQYFLIRDIISRYPLMGLNYLKGCWHEKCGKLERFTEANSRLPNSTIKEEKPLYKWFQVQQLLGTKGKLDKQQLVRLQQLAESFEKPGHFEKHFDKRFGELENFVARHSRLPRKSVSAEESLYNWFMVQLRRGDAGKLNSCQQKALKALCEPFQSVKPTWKERYHDVRIFAETYGRLPKRTALTQEEKVLNKWFMVQKDRMKRGCLVRRERKLIQFLIKRYGTAPGGHKLKPVKVMLGD